MDENTLFSTKFITFASSGGFCADPIAQHLNHVSWSTSFSTIAAANSCLDFAFMTIGTSSLESINATYKKLHESEWWKKKLINFLNDV